MNQLNIMPIYFNQGNMTYIIIKLTICNLQNVSSLNFDVRTIYVLTELGFVTSGMIAKMRVTSFIAVRYFELYFAILFSSC